MATAASPGASRALAHAGASIGPEHAVRLSHATRQFASDTGLTRDDLLTLPAQDILASRVFNTQTPQET